jgi:ribosome-binding protein aMBF1 (putative translation factor)
MSRSSPPDRWSAIRERRISDATTREQYERMRASVSTVRQLLQSLDAERERVGVSKTELARRVGASPAAVRRLFTSPAANPTMRTIVDLFGALNMDVTVRRRTEQSLPADAKKKDLRTVSADTH